VIEKMLSTKEPVMAAFNFQKLCGNKPKKIDKELVAKTLREKGEKIISGNRKIVLKLIKEKNYGEPFKRA